MSFNFNSLTLMGKLGRDQQFGRDPEVKNKNLFSYISESLKFRNIIEKYFDAYCVVHNLFEFVFIV
jgi:hypothetical protein